MFSLFKYRKKTNLKISELRYVKPKTLNDLLLQFDVFYLCYNEPNKNENWRQIKRLVSGVKKIEGIKGFDQALKVCAKKSRTEHFFLIDGDNQINQSKLNEQVVLPKLKDQWVLSWAALNPLNGLAYGNGGLKLWPKNVALELQSHENSRSEYDQTDYCFLSKYFLVDQYATLTHVTTTAQQAFRAGFREGVKMSLAWGKQVNVWGDNFETSLGPENRMRLKAWCEVGADVPNGYWAILGARMGLKYNAILKFNVKNINSYAWLDELMLKNVITPLGLSNKKLEEEASKTIPLIKALGVELNSKIPLHLELMSASESKAFKKMLVNPPRSGRLC